MRKIWAAAIIAGALATAPPAFTDAVFHDAGAPGRPGFSYGRVDISTAPASELMALPDMTPGDVASDLLTVTNTGGAPSRYALVASATGSEALIDELSLSIKTGAGACSNDGFASGGSTLYSGPLKRVAIGDPSQGAQPGDRTLGPGRSDRLCFQVRLPLEARNPLQGKATTVTFTFDAEQTSGN